MEGAHFRFEFCGSVGLGPNHLETLHIGTNTIVIDI